MKFLFPSLSGELRPRVIIFFLLVAAVLFASELSAQGFPNVARTPGELLAGPIAPEQGRTAIVGWHGERIVSVPEAPGSQPGADLQVRVVNIEDLDTTGPVVTALPTAASGFHAHGYFKTGAHMFIGPHCLGGALDPCNGTFPHDEYRNALRIGGAGTAIGDSELRRSDIAAETGLLLGSVQRAGAQSPWGLNDFWTYNTVSGDSWLAVRRNNEWVYDWPNGGAAVGPAVKATWDHLGLTGVTGFPFIMGNILIFASDQAGSGVATYDISDLSNPVLLDVLKENSPGGYWPDIYGHYLFFPRRDGEGGVGSQAGFMVVDFEDPTDLRIVANRNLEGSNQYVTFQDEYAFMNRYKIDMRTFDVELELATTPGLIDASQFALPVGNLLITGGYGSDGPGLAVWAHQAAADTRSPFVAYHVPVPDQINYSVDCPITVSIPETLKSETIVDGASLILQPVGGSPIATWHAFSQGKILTVTPQQPLLPDTTYEFILTSAIEDAAGNGLEPYSFRFSTGGGLAGGNQPPSVTSITIAPATPAPGVSATISWTGNDPDTDPLEFRVDPGDGSPLSAWSAAAGTTHTYTDAGHYQLTVQVRDDQGAVAARSQVVTVMAPPAAPNSTASGMLALNSGNNRLFTVNPDNDTVTAIDTTTDTVLWEAGVDRYPMGVAQGSDSSLWVTCRDSDSIAVLDPNTGATEISIPLAYGAAPVAIAPVPGGAEMLVSLDGDASLARFNLASRAQTDSLPLGPSPRAIAVADDGTRALVTRFISGEDEGTVYHVSLAGGMSLSGTIRLGRDHSNDGAASGRGVPNYLASIRITPDGQWAWVAGKKDNTTRGTFFAPTMIPGQDSTVRAMLMLIDLGTGVEDTTRRLDIDNSESPSAIVFSALGDYALIALQGNNQIGVIDVLDFMINNSPGGLMTRWGTGLAPQGVAVDAASGTVYSKDFLGRSVSAIDTADFFALGSLNATTTPIPTVNMERLHPAVLRGKQIFYNAGDTRMSAEGYISCATCHIDGGHDGRTWDFTNRGEGFRNTTDLRGRSGMGHGNVHWSANFDEIQDFENDIRGFFGGSGFLTDPEFASTSSTLGTAKAGLNADLDALAAYVTSLGPDTLPRNPDREPNGDLSAAAIRGQAVFNAEGCDTCHVPVTGYTDRLTHDVGTLRASSGQRLGGPLTGIDTPTLLGVHATAPYFHDGSAATLAEVFTSTGGALIQAEDATLSGGAVGEDIPWFPMKEWHGGEYVEINTARTVTFDATTTTAGAGYIEVRYSVRYNAVTMNVVVNGGVPIAVALPMLPNLPTYVPSEWRRVRVPVTFVAGANTIAINQAFGGALTIDDVLISTPDDAAAASAHVRGLSAGDLDDLVAYVASLDASNAAAPDVSVQRGGVIAPGATDNLAIAQAGQEESFVYTIENTGSGTLDLGAFHIDAVPSGEIWISTQPAPQVLPGESTTLEVRTNLGGSAADAVLHAWTNAPGADNLTWNIAATTSGGEGEGECEGECLVIEADGPSVFTRAVGESVTFSVTATGDMPITYQWYREDDTKAVIELDGETGTSLTLTDLDIADSARYFCVLEDATAEMDQSPVFYLTVVSALPGAGLSGLVVLVALISAVAVRRRRSS